MRLGLLSAIITVMCWTQVTIALDAVSLEKKAPETITSLNQVKNITRATQAQFWQLIPPVNDPLYIHPDNTARAVDWKSRAWPKSILKQMVAEMETVNRSMYPIYRLTVVETRSGEMVYYNSYNQEVWRTPAPLDYNPLLFAFELYGLESEKELTEQQKIFGRSSNIGVEILLLPTVFIGSYEEDIVLESQAQFMQTMPMAPMAPMGMMMSMGSEPELQMDIDRLTNGTVEVFVEWLSSLDSDSLDLFHATDLVVANWQLETNFPTAGSTNFYFQNLETNQTARFYVTGTDYDEDNDLISSARERYLYLTREDLPDTDGDGLDDGWELEHGFNPLSLPGAGEGSGDADGDGLTNLEEYIAGSDPHQGWNEGLSGSFNIVFFQPDTI